MTHLKRPTYDIKFQKALHLKRALWMTSYKKRLMYDIWILESLAFEKSPMSDILWKEACVWHLNSRKPYFWKEPYEWLLMKRGLYINIWILESLTSEKSSINDFIWKEAYKWHVNSEGWQTLKRALYMTSCEKRPTYDIWILHSATEKSPICDIARLKHTYIHMYIYVYIHIYL